MKAKLELAKSRLEVVGSVLERRRPGRPTVWVARYRERAEGRSVRRSIYLGEEAIAKRARTLIRQWRKDKIPAENGKYENALRLLDLSARARGFSGRARRRLQEAGSKAAEDPRDMLRFVLSHPDPVIQFGGRAGRPAKSGLW